MHYMHPRHLTFLITPSNLLYLGVVKINDYL